MIAEGVAGHFVEFEPLEAYRYDIAGSILGIAAFCALVHWAPPVALGRRRGHPAVRVLLAPELRPLAHAWPDRPRCDARPRVAGAACAAGRPTTRSRSGRRTPTADRTIYVNGIPHQTIVPLASCGRSSPFYFVPYDAPPAGPAGRRPDRGRRHRERRRHRAARRREAHRRRRDRPEAAADRRDLHPDHPYQDPRVSVHINDGRAFLEQTDTKYDLILFALPDSLTLVSGQSSLRLESYLFTREAMEPARDHLKPGGAFAMYNFYREPGWSTATRARCRGLRPCAVRRHVGRLRPARGGGR